jgi:hypothetical protein
VVIWVGFDWGSWTGWLFVGVFLGQEGAAKKLCCLTSCLNRFKCIVKGRLKRFKQLVKQHNDFFAALFFSKRLQIAGQSTNLNQNHHFHQ